MKKLLILFLSMILVGTVDSVQAQESVDDTEKFARRCLRKVRNRRFRKLKEAYPQAMKDIKTIIANAKKEKFGYDEVVKKAPDWIEMMNKLKQFPNHQVERKGKVINFEIVDYQPVLDTAKTKANEAHYKEGIKIMEKHENVHEFSNQEWARKYYNKTGDWIPNYRSAEERADAAEERMEINVLFYEQPAFVAPSEAGFASRGYIKAPFKQEWEHLTLNPVENPEYAVREVGMGFILVYEGEKGTYNYDKYEKTDNKEVTVYIARKKDKETGEIIEDEKTKAEYNALKKGQEIFDEDGGISLHKYSGTATYHYPTAKVTVDNTVEIWDLRDPTNPVKAGEVTSHFSASDKSSYMTYDGHPRAKPDFHNRYGDLKSKNELIKEIHGKVMDEPTVYKNCIADIRKVIKDKVEYIHFYNRFDFN